VHGIELPIPRPVSLGEKRQMYKFQDPKKDGFPPHLDIIPTKDQTNIFQIFDTLGLLEASTMLHNIVPNTLVSSVSQGITARFHSWLSGDHEKGITIADIERQNKIHRKSGTDVMK
jgi:hypothetical protein